MTTEIRLLASLLFLLGLAGCSSGESTTKTEPSGTDVVATPSEAAACPGVTVTRYATISTSYGDIVVGLFGQDAPRTVANFIGLAQDDFYDGILFHRVVRGFVIQAGDPKTKDPAKKSEWGTGGSSIYDGQAFDDELDPDAPSSKCGYMRGMLAMANSGPNTNRSQFFIVSGQASHLPPAYTIFGAVYDGMDVVATIDAVPHNNTIPREPVIITDVEIRSN